MTCTSRWNSNRSSRDSLLRSPPLYSTFPSVGAMKPSRSLARVVFPLPVSPTTPVIEGELSFMDKDTFSNATVSFLLKRPPLLKTLVTFRASRSTVIS
ncbi:hypothetical protein ES703_66674 [subsurface metagenome]